MVYVLSKEGKPLMPTKRHGKVRHLLNSGKARVVRTKPFTIRLTYQATEFVQPATLGIDAGYETVGFSAVNGTDELAAGECQLLKGQSARLKDRASYRRTRRNRKRYREPRFDNRKRCDSWLAPSIQNKLDTHIRIVNLIRSLVPVSEVIVEIASFDIQKLKNSDIEGVQYQQGETLDFWNLREYILHRDGHKCQSPQCKNKCENPVLQVHHIGYWKNDYSDRPGNLITLCTRCHVNANHKEGKLLWGWEPKIKSFRPETFMSTVRWRMVNLLGCLHTYGYITKTKRIDFKIEKSHVNDAFVIAGGRRQERCSPMHVRQVRRNNRCLQKFYDASYVDTRTGSIENGQVLYDGRRVRNKDKSSENLRVFRGHKVKKGRVSIRRKRYALQPKDTVLYRGQKYLVKGVQNKGAYVKLEGLKKPVKASEVAVLNFGKGFYVA